jgi:hypothetical protein
MVWRADIQRLELGMVQLDLNLFRRREDHLFFRGPPFFVLGYA